MPSYFESGVFTDGKAAWHGAGIVRPEPGLTVEKVFELVPQLASDVIQVPLFPGTLTPGPMGQGPAYPLKAMPDHFATVREYDSKPLGVVGYRYKVLQNRDAFGFVSDLVDTGGAIIKTAGTLRDGKTVWFLCQLPDTVQVGGLDTETIETYILVSNSHDGSSAVTVAIVTVRVVCSNTLAAALGSAPRLYKIRHTSSVEGKLAEARKALDITFEYQKEFEVVAGQLLNTKLTDEDFTNFLRELVPDVVNAEGEKSKTPPKVRAQIAATLSMTDDLADIKGTAWGALQAVSAYVDHKATYKSSRNGTREENRFESIVSGTSLASKAATLLTASLA